MRYVPLLLALMFVVSCGKESSKTNSRQESNTCLYEGDEKCDTIQAADGLGIDLLDTIVDVSINVSNSEITFLESKVSRQEGRRISCETEVRNGEVYRFSVNGNKLNLKTDTGNFTFIRLNDEGASIIGAWNWKGYVDQGTHVIKTITFISENRAIIKTHCEI